MNIGIFVEVMKYPNPTGITRYVKGLVEALVALNTPHKFFLYYQRYPKEVKLDWLEGAKNVEHKGVWVPTDLVGEHPNIWWKYYFPLKLYLDKIDVFHGPNHMVPLRGNVPTLITIHDIAYYFMKVHGAQLDSWLKELTNVHMRKANRVVAISEATASDCQRQGVPKNKIEVVYQGFEFKPDKNPEEKLLDKFGLRREVPYILFLGTIQPRKNPEYLIAEYAKVAKKIPHQLVLAGAEGDASEAVDKLIVEHAIQDKVIKTGFITDNERHALYSFADLFVYPSLYEGFGLVILEAMSYGLPVISANNSGIPEAAGDAALLVDISKSSNLAHAILRVVNDESFSKHLSDKGLIQASKFNWSSSAKKLICIYEQLYTNKN